MIRNSMKPDTLLPRAIPHTHSIHINHTHTFTQTDSNQPTGTGEMKEQSVQRKLFKLSECEDVYRKQADDLGMDEETVSAKIAEARMKRHPKNKMLQEIYDANQELPDLE